MKTLVIAEKPSVGRDIARVLKCGKNNQGALEGERYVVVLLMIGGMLEEDIARIPMIGSYSIRFLRKRCSRELHGSPSTQ